MDGQIAHTPESTPDVAKKPEWQVIVDLLREIKSPLVDRIGRKMMNYLVKRNVKQVDRLLEKLTAAREGLQASVAYNPNEPMPRFNLSLLEPFIDDIFQIAADEITAD